MDVNNASIKPLVNDGNKENDMDGFIVRPLP